MKKISLLTICAAIVAFSAPANADLIFSNNFDDGNFAPEVGTWNFTNTSVESVVDVTQSTGPNGSGIGLIDQSAPTSGTLNGTINLIDTAILTGGNTVTIDFDLAARRTNGNARTIFLDALDSNGAIVTRLVLGDSNAFGNGGGDRQRIGYDIDSTGNDNTGNSVFNLSTGTGATGGVNGTVNAFWFGADNNLSNGFDNDSRDAQVSLTIGESSFGIETQRAFAGETYSTSGVANYNGGTFADVASFQLTSAGSAYGIYLDNIEVNATLVASAVPEPGSLVLFGLSAVALGVRRRR